MPSGFHVLTDLQERHLSELCVFAVNHPSDRGWSRFLSLRDPAPSGLGPLSLVDGWFHLFYRALRFAFRWAARLLRDFPTLF